MSLALQRALLWAALIVLLALASWLLGPILLPFIVGPASRWLESELYDPRAT